MTRLVMTTDLLEQIRSDLLASANEACAVLSARAVYLRGELCRLVVNDVRVAAPSDYLLRSPTRASLSPQFVASVAHQARIKGESLVFVHSHPFPLNEFSSIDDDGERALADFLAFRTGETPHAAMVVTPDASCARRLGRHVPLLVSGVGATLRWGLVPNGIALEPEFDRQVRAFGEAGQAQLRRMRVAIIGLGGTGSVVAQQLVYLGVTDLIFIDPDVVELTNLNRLVGAGPADVGRPKVDVAAEAAQRINPQVKVRAIKSSVLLKETAMEVADADFAFACTDSQGSRTVLNQFAYQYLVPTIDMGVVVVTSGTEITSVAGRTQMLAPGLGCMQCGNLLDAEAVRVDLLSDFERVNDPYVKGVDVPAPAVISLNSTAASAAVTMFLGAALGLPLNARLINYNAMTGTTRPAVISRHPTCIVCSHEGALAKAHAWTLPVRAS